MNRMFVRLILTLTVLASSGARAQDIASSDGLTDPASDTALDAAPLSVVERWEADPLTIFDGSEIVLADLQYIARPLVVFADSPNDPNFIEQLQLIEAQMVDLAVRDVIVVADADPSAASDLRQSLRPRGFVLMLIDKDGRIIQRKPSPWDVREITRGIDKTPLRQQEIREAG